MFYRERNGEAHLAMVSGEGNIRDLKLCAAGPAPVVAARGTVEGSMYPQTTVRIEFDPQIQVCDLDGDGLLEIVCTDKDSGKLTVLDATGNRKSWGPMAPAGALSAGDLDGDGTPEVIFLDSRSELSAFSGHGKVLHFSRSMRPLMPSAVAAVNLDDKAASQVVYIDSNRHLRVANLNGPERFDGSVECRSNGAGSSSR